MKKIIIYLLLSISINSKAQNTDNQNFYIESNKDCFDLDGRYISGCYLKATDIDIMQGTWQSVEGRDTLTMFLKKFKVNLGKFGLDENDIKVKDMLLGCHRFVLNGMEIESNFNFKQDIINTKEINGMFQAFSGYSVNLTTLNFSKENYGKIMPLNELEGHIFNLTNSRAFVFITFRYDPVTRLLSGEIYQPPGISMHRNIDNSKLFPNKIYTFRKISNYP